LPCSRSSQTWLSAARQSNASHSTRGGSLAVEVSRLWITPLSASTPMWAFMPKNQSLPFLVDNISGSRAPALFFVEDGALMIVASTSEPPRLYRRVICSTTRRPYRVCSGLRRTPPLLLRGWQDRQRSVCEGAGSR
jgi:hypothetical protein